MNSSSSDNEFQIGLEQICSIGTSSLLDPKQLICCICFCININPKQCKNKKCNKLYCEKCYEHLKNKPSNNIKVTLCPFCRTVFDYRQVDNNLLSSLASLKFYCTRTISCSSQYSYSDLITKHNHPSSSSLVKCTNCKKETNDWKTIAKCINCLGYFCSPSNNSSNCIRKCSNCLGIICYNCTSSNTNVLCGLCDCKCSLCKSNEASQQCSLCNHFLCSSCGIYCDTCHEYQCPSSQCIPIKASKCDKCSNIKATQLYFSCIHQLKSSCIKCHPKCLGCTKQHSSNHTCAICSLPICSSTCSIKCKGGCNSIICESCSLKCSICKKTTCTQCCKWCHKCGLNNSIITCLKCCNDPNSNSNIIRKCNNVSCDNNLCINCWNVCNYCNIINCSKHSFSCVNCEENMCNQHFSSCNDCQSQSDMKCCLKNCTFKCSFCSNETNAICKKDNHSKTMVSSYNCEHYICVSCVKYCGECHSVVISCPKCIVNYYFSHCKYCDEYLCQGCSSNSCVKCEEAICSMEHRCYCCRKKIPEGRCLKCLFRYRMKCFYCEKGMRQGCVKCCRIVVCSLSCYYGYRIGMGVGKEGKDKSEGKILIESDSELKEKHMHDGEIDEMFFCNKHMEGSEEEMKNFAKEIGIVNKRYMIELITCETENQEMNAKNNDNNNNKDNGDDNNKSTKKNKKNSNMPAKRRKCPSCIIY